MAAEEHQEGSGAVLARTVAAVRPADATYAAKARDRLDRLAKPRGSLGVLEDVAVQLAGLAGACPPPLPSPAAVAVFAGDHGVHAQGVTPWPQAVTRLMVGTFLEGGAAVNALATQVGAQVVVVDVGVAGPVPGPPSARGGHSDGAMGGPVTAVAGRLLYRRVRAGTRDLSLEPAMTLTEVVEALEVGVAVADTLVDEGHRCLLTGDMGIANTTASAALVAAFTGADPEAVTGRGTGVDDETLRRKTEVVRTALARHDAAARDGDGGVGTGGGTVGRGRVPPAVEVLASLGGLEHAAIAGFVLGAAARRVPVILDGVIAGAAALAAAAIAPAVVDACLAGHRSAEPGHAVALTHLGLRPLVELDLRLGEGTGALLALPIVQAAVRASRDMATLDSAGGA